MNEATYYIDERLAEGLPYVKRQPLTIENVNAVHNTRHQNLICGEGVPHFCGRTLDTALRPYDGLVTPYGVIDFSQF